MIYLPWIIALTIAGALAALVSAWLLLIPGIFLFALFSVRYMMRYAIND